MTFLHTALFAAGAACVAIPILIHLLLRQRRKPIRWGAMRFLIEAYKKQRRKLKLQQLILLATRCLIVFLVAMALGRPLLEQAGLLGAGQGTTLYVLVDNGLASSARGTGESGDSSGLEQSKQAARDLLRELGPGDRAGLIALGGPAEPVVIPASADLSAIASLIDGLEPTASATDLSGALDLLGAHLASEAEGESAGARVVIAVMSEFLLGSADISRPLPESLAQIPNVSLVAMEPASASGTNVQIVGVEPLNQVVLTGTGGSSASVGRENVRVRLRRSGPGVSDAQVTQVRLRVSGGRDSRLLPGMQVVYRWQPGETEGAVTVQIDPASGSDNESGARSLDQRVLVAEIDRDTVDADNTFRRPIDVREALRVGVIARRRFGSVGGAIEDLQPGDWLRLALRPSFAAPIDVVEIDPGSIDAPTLASVDVAFAASPELIRETDWTRIAEFVERGGLLIVTPAPEAPVQLWSDAMSRELGLDWRIAREAQSPDGGSIGIDPRAGDSALLTLIRAEIEDLVRPVAVERYLPIESDVREADVVLRLADGTPWLVVGEPARADDTSGVDRGLVVYLASAPQWRWTNLQATSLMVPLVQELARQGFGRASGDWTSVAGRRIGAPERATQLAPVGVEQAPVDLDGSGRTMSPIRSAGLWEAIDEAGRVRGFVAVNADDQASRVQIQDPSSVRAWLSAAIGQAGSGAGDANGAGSGATFLDPDEPGAVFSAEQADSPLSVPLLIAALMLALAEVFMARWFSHAIAERSEGGPSLTESMGLAP